jgi:transposase
MMCRLHLDSIRGYNAAVADLDARIAAAAAPWQQEACLLKTIPGFGDVVARTWIAEIGPAPHEWFSSAAKLASWAGLAPGNYVSAGKRRHGRAGTYIKPALVEGAWAAVKHNGRLRARCNALVRRMGGARNPVARKKAIIAIAHTMLKIAYAVLKSGQPCQEPGADFCTRREQPARRQAWLETQIQKLYPGCTVTVTVTPPPGGPAPGSAQPPPGASPPGAAHEAVPA